MTFGILTDRKCTERCWNAKSKSCRCSCAGTNHGTKRRDTGIYRLTDEPAATGSRVPSLGDSEKFVIGLADSRDVYLQGRRLNPIDSQRLYNHSPDGFNWGYHGSGVAQLALAILQHELGDRKAAMYYQKFKAEVLAPLKQGADFKLPMSLVDEWIKKNVTE